MSLKVNVKFEADPPAFDLDGYETTPLTCSKKDSEWSLTIPNVKNNQAGDTAVELESSDLDEFFIYSDGLIALDPERIGNFTTELCKEKTEISFNFNLVSPTTGKASEKLTVQIALDEKKENTTEAESESSTSDSGNTTASVVD